jgi:ATP-dependent phosphoenolpyruvate carboxykinase
MKTESTDKEESLRKLGLLNLGKVHWDLSTAALYEESIRRYEGILSHLGPLVIRTGQFTGGPGPRRTWKDPAAYDGKARELARMFANNFDENAGDAPSKVRKAGPDLS